MLFRHHGWDLRSYFLGSLGGRDLEQVAKSLGRLEKWGPGTLFDITLPLHFQRKADTSKTPDSGEGRAQLEKVNKDPKVQIFNLERLQGKLKKLVAGYKTGGAWADYTTTCSYDSDAEKSKKTLVREFLGVAGAKRVLDIGCNTGDYSYLAAETGASTHPSLAINVMARGTSKIKPKTSRNHSAKPTYCAMEICGMNPALTP